MITITLTIDDQTITTEKGKTILQAALKNGIYIPHLCYHPDLRPVGVCRMCVVEIEGKGLVTSCNTPAAEGMKVSTNTPQIDRIRRIAAELVITNHKGECLQCASNTKCKLQEVVNFIGIDEARMARMRKEDKMLPLDTSNPFFDRDPNKCILCGICVRTCEELQGVGAVDFTFRGFDTTVAPFARKPIAESTCLSCGECVVRCPVGALIPKKFAKPSREVKTVCAYCGCGCGLYLGVRGNKVVSARGEQENPASGGSLCVKGRFAHGFVNHPARLKTPLIRKNGKLKEATWDEAIDLVTKKFARYKGDQFAAISSPRER
ncbi:2Fe-2S iron-sulfur cluster-binding protein [Verrucomicrobiota bacterium]